MRAAHRKAFGKRFLPGKPGKRTAGEFGSLPGQRVTEVRAWNCTDDAGSGEEAARRMRAAVRRNEPLLLRGCARAMPAIELWRDDEALAKRRWQTGVAAQPQDIFGPVLKSGKKDSVGKMDAAWTDDYRWSSPLSDALLAMTETPHAWVSPGGKRAVIHFDTVDNAHVIVASKKKFLLASPIWSQHMYIDFPTSDRTAASSGGDERAQRAMRGGGARPAQADVQCPDRTSFGCDSFGCFAYPPFNADAVDLDQYPRVAEVEVVEAMAEEGDVLLVPAFWFHRVFHLPLGGGGRCIALAFISQSTWNGTSATMAPWARDVVARRRAVEAAAEAEVGDEDAEAAKEKQCNDGAAGVSRLAALAETIRAQRHELRELGVRVAALEKGAR